MTDEEKFLLAKCLSRFDMKQSAPRVGTVMTRGGLIRLAFPWVTIGKQPQSMRENYGFYEYIYVYFHNEPWRDLNHAVEILRSPPDWFHASGDGLCCIGDDAADALVRGEMTATEAFWNTSYELSLDGLKANRLAAPMFDIANPKNVLTVEWNTLDWVWLCDEAEEIYTAPEQLWEQV